MKGQSVLADVSLKIQMLVAIILIILVGVGGLMIVDNALKSSEQQSHILRLITGQSAVGSRMGQQAFAYSSSQAQLNEMARRAVSLNNYVTAVRVSYFSDVLAAVKSNNERSQSKLNFSMVPAHQGKYLSIPYPATFSRLIRERFKEYSEGSNDITVNELSGYPINPKNRFRDEHDQQADKLLQGDIAMGAEGLSLYLFLKRSEESANLRFYMPDLAMEERCVECHNALKGTEYKVGDMMGLRSIDLDLGSAHGADFLFTTLEEFHKIANGFEQMMQMLREGGIQNGIEIGAVFDDPQFVELIPKLEHLERVFTVYRSVVEDFARRYPNHQDDTQHHATGAAMASSAESPVHNQSVTSSTSMDGDHGQSGVNNAINLHPMKLGQLEEFRVFQQEVAKMSSELEDATQGVIKHFADIQEVIFNEQFELTQVVFAVAIYLAMIVGIVIHFTTVAPLNRIVEHMHKVSEGERSIRIDETYANRELNSVAVGINEMQDALQDTLATAEKTAQEIQMLNEANEDSIINLLDEISNLADGDLRTEATVSEQITGAVADSINFMIGQLLTVVRGINRTAQAISVASIATKETSEQLAKASTEQTEMISVATNWVGAMSKSAEVVATEVERANSVADESVAFATVGKEAVEKSIKGMSTIRDNIQETSKRIKRLGESSQEIGDIVGLISEIAEQTNLLSLNAAIQAAMAGEAGRGFAVVADEIQRLAERSTDATKKIGTLVKTIQADTGEAISSMEKSTSYVVLGGELTEEAGQALESIDAVSASLANIVRSIAKEAENQSKAAIAVQKKMHIIQDVSRKTSDGASHAAEQVSSISLLTHELQGSVSHFKLPSELADMSEES